MPPEPSVWSNRTVDASAPLESAILEGSVTHQRHDAIGHGFTVNAQNGHHTAGRAGHPDLVGAGQLLGMDVHFLIGNAVLGCQFQDQLPGGAAEDFRAALGRIDHTLAHQTHP